MTPKVNTTPCNNPPNPLPNVLADLDLDPSLYDYSLPDSLDSSDNNSYKRRRRAKNNKNKCRSKTCFDDPIKKCETLAAKLITDTHKSKVVKFKLDKDPLQRQLYFLSFMNLVKTVLSQFKETYMLLM